MSPTGKVSRHVKSLALAASMLSTTAFGWGSEGHEAVNGTAVDLMTSPLKQLFDANDRHLERLANTPDRAWKRGDLYERERHTHFFHWDVYGSGQSDFMRTMPRSFADLRRLHDMDYINENGSSVWRVGGIYERMVRALKNEDWYRAVQLAGVMGHYIGDMSQPMHVTMDYDGQSIGQRGIHKHFETTLVNDMNKRQLRTDVRRHGRDYRNWYPRRDSNRAYRAMQVSVNQGRKSFEALDEVLDDYTDGRNVRSLKNQIPPLMARGAAVLAQVWDMAADAAGIDHPNQVPDESFDRVEDPDWLPIDVD